MGSFVRRQLRAINAELWRVSGPLPKLSQWAWAADAVLALLLTVATVDSALRRGDTTAPVEMLPPDQPTDRYPTVPDLPGLPGPQPHPPMDQFYPETTWWQVGLAVLVALPLLTRRRYPLASLWIIVAVAQVLYHDSGFDPTAALICFVVAAYSAVLYSRYRTLAIGSVVAAAAGVALINEETGPGFAIFLLLCAVGLTANAIHTWKQRALALQREQDTATTLAVQQERARLAGELHDVVSHSVSMMVVQAGAARTVLSTAPDLAREALLAVESSGRAAMVELRHVMGLLTMDGDGPDLAPTPGLDQLGALADGVRRTGVRVGLLHTGTRVPLPAGVELAAYRVVQEALTNTVKHAAGAAVTVTVAHTPTSLRIDVTDTGGTADTLADPGSGRGLAGLRDRLDVHGGSLSAGPTGAGGFRIQAVIPIGEA